MTATRHPSTPAQGARTEAFSAIVPRPGTCPDCGAKDVRWRFEGAFSLTDPPFLMRGAWVHRHGMQVHAVVWTPEQVAAVRDAVP